MHGCTIKAKKRLRTALNIYLLGINTILCFFSLFQPKRTCFFFFRQTRSFSRTQQQRDTCSSTLTFAFQLALSQLFLRLGLARLGFTRGSRSRCCNEGVFSPLQVEFVLTKFTDPACYPFGFFSNCRNCSRHVFANT